MICLRALLLLVLLAPPLLLLPLLLLLTLSDELDDTVCVLPEVPLLLLLFPPMRDTADNGSLNADNGSKSTIVLVATEDITAADATTVAGSRTVVPFDFTMLDVADFCNGCTVVDSVFGDIRCFSVS